MPDAPMPPTMSGVIPVVGLFAFVGATLATFSAFLSVILDERGFDPPAIGLVAALSAVAFMVAIPIWGHVADVVLGRPRALRLAAILSAASLLLIALPLPPVAIVVAITAYAAAYAPIAPLADALAVNTLPNPARQYGPVRSVTSGAFATCVLLVGMLYAVVGYGPAPFLFAAAAFGIVLVSGRLADRQPAALIGHRRGGAAREAFAVQPRLPGILLAIGLAYVGVLAGFTFLSLRIIDIGGGPQHVGLAASVAAAAEIGAMIVAGRIAPRIGLRALFTMATLLHVVSFVLWMVLPTPELIILSRALSGAAFSGTWIGSVLVMQAVLPRRLQATGQGLFGATAFGVASLVANVLGGIIYGSMGSAVLFGICALLGGIGAVVAWLTFPRRGEPPVEPAPQPIAAEPAAAAVATGSAAQVEVAAR
jgi:MFS transporter, PPP family, 3-phenylpropionic acid transporter